MDRSPSRGQLVERKTRHAHDVDLCCMVIAPVLSRSVRSFVGFVR